MWRNVVHLAVYKALLLCRNTAVMRPRFPAFVFATVAPV